MHTMNKMKLWMLAAIILCGGIVGVTSCTPKSKTETEAKSKAEAPISKEKSDSNLIRSIEKSPELYGAIGGYLTDSIGVHYSPGELCIPCPTVIAWDRQNPDSVRVLGDFWVFNYNVVGDTLKTVSGGSHPGAMYLKKIGKRYVVTSFDRVGDGSNFLPSAKRIFGDMYEAFHSINSNEETREQARAIFIAAYVKSHQLPVKYYQDYGWPAREIPSLK